MPFEILLTDQFFYDSPYAGTDTCVCSRCGNRIDVEPVIRAWPTDKEDYGYDPKAPGGTGFRYHPACVGATVFPAIDYDNFPM